MPLWGNTDSSFGNSKPKFLLAPNYISPYSGQTGNNSNVAGVSVTEKANTSGYGPKVTHAGWVAYSLGTGPVVGFNITNAGRGYSNNDYVTFTGGGGGTAAGGVAANAQAVVNANGSIISVTINQGGSLYNSAPTVVFANTSNTSTAVLTAVMGGRVGRFNHEVLVAMSSITADNPSDNTAFPGL